MTVCSSKGHTVKGVWWSAGDEPKFSIRSHAFVVGASVSSLEGQAEIKLPAFVGSWRKHGSSRKNFCSIDYIKAFDCINHNKVWKILKEMGIPDHLTCPLRNLFAGQETTVGTGHETTDWFKIGKEVWQGYILSSCLFIFWTFCIGI